MKIYFFITTASQPKSLKEEKILYFRFNWYLISAKYVS